jgi:uncharacterized protein (TIGR00290 family)
VCAEEAFVLSWSGGKDSALALWLLRRAGREPHALLTTVTESYGRVSMHGVRRALLQRQAERVGVSLVEVEIPALCSNEVYEERLAEALSSAPLHPLGAVAFGDLFLEDVRAYREQRLAALGIRGIFPLWRLDTTQLAGTFIAAGFEATLVCVDPRRLDRSFAGRAYVKELLADLPKDVDPCGENGEFHSFVTAGPIFTAAISCRPGETIERDGFIFTDLIPT